jgi:hypothetical protein
MSRPETSQGSEFRPYRIEDRLLLAAEYLTTACPVLLNLENVAPPATLGSTQKSSEVIKSEIGRIVEAVLRQPIEVILIKGLPGVGKTRVLKELVRLFSFLGFDVDFAQYDQVLQAVAPVLGLETDTYDEDAWYYVSHLLLVRIFEPESINMGDPSIVWSMFQRLQRNPETKVDQQAAVERFLHASLPQRNGRRRLVILEAPAVATVQGKDRGRTAEKTLGAREKMFQTHGQLGHQMTISIVPHLATMDHAILERNSAVEIDEVMTGNENDPLLLHRLEPYLSKLRLLRINPITSSNYVWDLQTWIAEQRAAAPETFIRSMYREEVARVEAWMASDKPKHTVMKSEVRLPREMIASLKPSEVEIAKIMAACYEDEALAIGIRPENAHVVTNQFKTSILER